MTRVMLQPRKSVLRQKIADQRDAIAALDGCLCAMSQSRLRWSAIAFLTGITFGGSVVYGLVGV